MARILPPQHVMQNGMDSFPSSLHSFFCSLQFFKVLSVCGGNLECLLIDILNFKVKDFLPIQHKALEKTRLKLVWSLILNAVNSAQLLAVYPLRDLSKN